MERQIYVEYWNGFRVETWACIDGTDPRESGLCDKHAAAVTNGELEWFTARVVVSKEGVELADEYLGGCAYEIAEDFIRDSGYYEDMRASAVAQAIDRIKRLAWSIDGNVVFSDSETAHG